MGLDDMYAGEISAVLPNEKLGILRYGPKTFFFNLGPLEKAGQSFKQGDRVRFRLKREAEQVEAIDLQPV